MEEPSLEPIHRIVGAKIISQDFPSDRQYDIHINGQSISNIISHDNNIPLNSSSGILDGRGCLIGPSLCHAHIHLDKSFLLNDPKYSDLSIQRGDFSEALEITSIAKSRFSTSDLLRRGRWLIEESIAAGVTLMRAFAEVDNTVSLKCLDVAIALKNEYKNCCEIQICAFAQDPIFSHSTGEKNREILLSTLQNPDVAVLGTTPYVETSEENKRQNITWAITQAISHHLHLDLHLDYTLSPSQPSLIHFLAQEATQSLWPSRNSGKTIALGHCTRLTLYSHEELTTLAASIQDLPISFIGLPTSDLYMMGRTLPIPSLIRTYNFQGAIAINNVGNAFTPQGNCDPLSVASLGVGVYQAGTARDARLLYECVSVRARNAIGYGLEGWEAPFAVGAEANFVIFGRPGKEGRGRRGRGSVQEVVRDPPAVGERRTVFRGTLVGL